MQKAIVWVLGLIIIIGAWFLFTTDSNKAVEPPQGGEPQAERAGVNAGLEAPATNTEGSQSGAAVVPAAVITYTDAGFNPASIAITKGQTVRWMNNSSASVWPASAVHPTHGVYPQKSSSDCLGSSFDSCRGLAKGESWDFIFSSVGSWKFHNHLNASKTGSVTVTE